MDQEEQVVASVDATSDASPKKKRAYHKSRRKAPKVIEPAKPTGEFEGLTPADCCFKCSMDKCVITHRNICAHPFKGGLQPAMMSDPEVLARYERAKRYLAHRTLDIRGQ